MSDGEPHPLPAAHCADLNPSLRAEADPGSTIAVRPDDDALFEAAVIPITQRHHQTDRSVRARCRADATDFDESP
jgi:hypothetical protein